MTAPWPRIPYGEMSFPRIRRNGWLYVDKTRFLRPLEDERYVFFIRPRRFGKSCWLALLECYYGRHWAHDAYSGPSRSPIPAQADHFSALTGIVRFVRCEGVHHSLPNSAL